MLNVSARAGWAHAALFVTALLLAGSRPSRAQDSVVVHVFAPTEIHGFLQTYYRSGDPTTTDGFRLRKADLKFNGQLSPHVRWRIGFDAAKALNLILTGNDTLDALALTAVNTDQRTRMLQDAAITWVQSKSFSADVGQQTIPLSLEGTIPTSSVETIERTMFIVERSRGTGLGDVRDVGASANGFTPVGIEYHGGVFNGTGDDIGIVDASEPDPSSSIATCASLCALKRCRPATARSIGSDGIRSARFGRTTHYSSSRASTRGTAISSTRPG
jgi:hypothetical protein